MAKLHIFTNAAGNNYQESLIFRGMYGEVKEHPENNNLVLFKVDEQIKACSNSMIALGDWLSAPKESFETIEASEQVINAIKVNLAVAMGKRWDKAYASQQSGSMTDMYAQALNAERNVAAQGIQRIIETYAQEVEPRSMIVEVHVRGHSSITYDELGYEGDDYGYEDDYTTNIELSLQSIDRVIEPSLDGSNLDVADLSEYSFTDFPLEGAKVIALRDFYMPVTERDDPELLAEAIEATNQLLKMPGLSVDMKNEGDVKVLRQSMEQFEQPIFQASRPRM